ncbi:MAG: protein-disulfide reductase DsbD [Succinivibrionaceae bacterium]
MIFYKSISKIISSTLIVLSLLLFNNYCSANDYFEQEPISNSINITPQFLPIEEAFIPSFTQNNNQITVKFNIHPKCYLYQERFKILGTNVSVEDVEIPEGEYHNDEYMGPSHIYHNQVEFTVHLSNNSSQDSEKKLEITYQGCTEGVCYPPTIFNIPISNFDNVISNQIQKTEQSENLDFNQNNSHSIYEYIKSASFLVGLAIFYALGLLLCFTPCMFPMYPIWSSIILGNKKKNFKTSLIYSFAYIQGIAITYMSVGIAIAYTGAKFHATLQQPLFLIGVSIIFFLLACSMFGVFTITLPNSFTSKIQNISDKFQGGTIIGVFVMGAISAIVASPCTTAPLAGALMFIVQDGSILKGGLYLYVLSLGIGTPLFIIGLIGQKYLPKNGNWMIKIKVIFGFILLGTPLLLLHSFIPSYIIKSLTILLLGSCIIYLININYSKKIIASLCLIALTLTTTTYLYNNESINNHSINKIQHINNINELNSFIKNNRLVMIDVRADWCRECIHYEETTFKNKNVIKALRDFKVAQIDISNLSNEKQDILNKYKVNGVPSILFFKNDKMIKKIDGYLDDTNFLQVLTSFKN